MSLATLSFNDSRALEEVCSSELTYPHYWICPRQTLICSSTNELYCTHANTEHKYRTLFGCHAIHMTRSTNLPTPLVNSKAS